MEEDIKLLEENIENGIIYCGCGYSTEKAIENLIARYKELEEENREIKKEFALNTEIHKRDEIIKDLKETIGCLHETDKENYISKSKVQEKIKEYEKQRIKMEEDDIGVGFTLGKEWSDLKAKIQVLQELLEE